MSEIINPLEAKRLREAFKNTKEDDSGKCTPAPVGDLVEIRAGHNGAKSDRFLYIFKDGEPIASVPIDNPALKRLKKQWLYWNDLSSGHISAFRMHEFSARR